MRKFSRSLLLVGALALTGGLAACGDDVTVSPPPVVNPPTPKVTGVTVAPSTGQVRVANTLQLNASVTADSGAVATIAWKSSDVTIATVDATGKVTGVKVGQVGITATATANGSSASGSATINVVQTSNVQSIVLNPNAVTLNPNQTQGVNATVTLDPTSTSSDKGVTWSSSNTASATVSAAGVITAVAPGNATITAKANADTLATATVSVTVRTPVATSISIQSITFGNLATPVNVNNVAGQIDVTLNVDPGENVVSKVEVLLDDKVVCTQAFSGAQNQALAAAAVNAAAAPVPIVCSVNTAQFDSAGVASFFNGTRKISARATTSTGTQVATPSQNLVFNNVSGFVAAVTNVNASGSVSAIGPNGLSWLGGDVTISLLPVSYVSGQAFTNVNLGALFGKTNLAPVKGADGRFSVTLTHSAATNWTATNTSLRNYVTPCPTLTTCVEPVTVGSSVVTGGGAGSNTILNFGAPAQGNATIPVLPAVRYDGAAPGITAVNPGAPAAVAIAPANAPVWVNASTALAPGSFGIPAKAVLDASDAGVDNVTATVYTGAATGAAFTTPASPTSCDLTALTASAVGSDLAATIVSTAYSARVKYADAVGNFQCVDIATIDAVGGLFTTFGADFTAPTATVTGPAANAPFTSAGAVTPFALAATDNASGFGLTPLTVSVTRQYPTMAVECVYGTAAGCINPATQPLTFNIVTGTVTNASQGYYTTTATLVDQAGNQTTVVSNRVNLVDATNPGFNGAVSLQSLYAGNATANFSTRATDNIDVSSVFGVLTYPSATIRFASQTIGTFGLPFELDVPVSYNIASFMRCLNAPTVFTAGATQPTAFTFTVSDQAANTATLSDGTVAAHVEPCGTVGDVAINTFATALPDYGTGKTQVSLDGTTTGATTSSTVTLRAAADVPLNTANNPFQRVEFYWVDGTGDLRLIGQATPTLAQTQTNRIWTYTLVWDPAAPVTAAATNIVAIGVDTTGDAVLTATQSVLIVP